MASPGSILKANNTLKAASGKALDVGALKKLLKLRDSETEAHSQMVASMTVRLAQQMGIHDKNSLTNIRYGALLHDIGKIGLPKTLLQKRGRLDEEEWKIIRLHPVIAGEIFAQIQHFAETSDIAQYHHERWDGTGYPRGLREQEIPLAARIFAVVDSWQALGADRPYRPAWPKNEVMDFLKQSAGTLFDPNIVRVFLDMMEGQDADV
jgi:putative nucleotidyltransferase with HDIG domain